MVFSLSPCTHRLLEIINAKIFAVQADDVRLDGIHSAGTKLYRVEEISRDEATLGESEALIPVAHFHREMFTTFGVPFLFKVTDVSVSWPHSACPSCSRSPM